MASGGEWNSSGHILDEINPNMRSSADQKVKTEGTASDVMGAIYMDQENRDDEPYLEIVEHPQQRGFRYRYECEGTTHGGLQGESTTKSQKIYPTVRIRNYNGPARITVTLVTDEDIPRPHAHELIGKNCKNGICVTDIKCSSNSVSFPNLGIRHSTRKRAVGILTDRILESIRSEKVSALAQRSLGRNYNQNDIDITEEDRHRAKREAEDQAKNMQLNVVRLCFQATLRDTKGNFFRTLPSCVSKPVYDSKCPAAAALKICRMDRHSGCCTGNDEIFMLCDKVQKDDISVRFFETDEDGNVKWEAFGCFGPSDVHRQYAIVFKTPAYWNQQIQEPVEVRVQLRRMSDNECSSPKEFKYYPLQEDLEAVARKSRKRLPNIGFGTDAGRAAGTHGNRTTMDVGFHAF